MFIGSSTWQRLGWLRPSRPYSPAVAALSLALSLATAAPPASAYDVDLSWDRIAQASSYRVFIRYGSDLFIQTTGAQAGTGSIIHYRVSGLPAGPTVFFRVSALDETNESPPSNEIALAYANVAAAIDSDADGLVDALEDTNLNGITDPGETDVHNLDSDGDGSSDGYEVLIAGTDPLDADSDGDGIIDSLDLCHDVDGDGFGDPAVAQSTCPPDNCPNASNPDQGDSDADGLGQACDPCTNIAGGQYVATKTSLIMNKVGTDPHPGNDTLIIKTSFSLPRGTDFSLLDPLSRGARLLIRSADGAARVDVSLPPGQLTRGRHGQGWQRSNSGKTWTYLNKNRERVGGIAKLAIKNLRKRSAEVVKILVRGKHGSYAVTADDMPIQATVTLGDQRSAAQGHCGETRFSPAQCSFTHNSRSLECRL